MGLLDKMFGKKELKDVQENQAQPGVVKKKGSEIFTEYCNICANIGGTQSDGNISVMAKLPIFSDFPTGANEKGTTSAWIGDIIKTREQAISQLNRIEMILGKKWGFNDEFSVLRDWKILQFIWYRFPELQAWALRLDGEYQELLYGAITLLRQPSNARASWMLPGLVYDLIELENGRFTLIEQVAATYKKDRGEDQTYLRLMDDLENQRKVVQKLLVENVTFVDTKEATHTDRMIDVYFDYQPKYSGMALTGNEEMKKSLLEMAELTREANRTQGYPFKNRYGVE